MHGLDSESWCGEDGPHDRRPSQLIMVGAMFANRAELLAQVPSLAARTPHHRSPDTSRRWAHRGTNCTNVEASQNYGICCAQRPDQAPAWLASRSAREETSMKKLAIRREHRINETRAESAIKDYVDHVADIAKFPDATAGTPDFDTPLGDTLPASIDPETAAGLASNLRAALPRIRELLGLLTRRGKEDG